MTLGREPEPVIELSSRFLWTYFEDGAVIFDQLTGDTHALDAVHAEALQRVLSAGPNPSGFASDAVTEPALTYLNSLGLV